jgi:hypothetical protein
MVTSAWQQFEDELAHWRDAGLPVEFWWRDDDARQPDPALRRLLAQADTHRVPLALAVIPEGVQAAAFESASDMVCVVQHGVDHINRAAVGEKETEFPAGEALSVLLARLLQGHAQLEALQGVRHVPVLVPPWNRISARQLPGELATVGYRGLSRFGARRSRTEVAGLGSVNTHVGIIDWHGTPGFAGEDFVLAQATRHLHMRRTGLADSSEPTGWLTHHAVHDEPAWAFMDRLFELTRARPGIRWLAASELFARPEPA